jgi:subtilisin family serine protease
VRANRGNYIAFAAPGVNINVRAGDEDLVVSGTSFAAPLVAAEIARQLQAPSVERARGVLHGLRQRAIDLGAPGRDPIFGWGAVRR